MNRAATAGALSLAPRASGNLLERPSLSLVLQDNLSPLQQQIDGMVGGFLHEATNGQTLIALLGAGMAYRFTRIGTMAAGSASWMTRAASLGTGLAVESAAFTGINRGFKTWNGLPSSQSFAQEWLHSAISLGSLKAFGRLGQGQNLTLRHLLMDTGMVSGHYLAHAMGLSPRPQGSLAEQLLNAEAMNWQMAAGLSLTYRLAPRLAEGERALELQLRSGPFPGILPDLTSAAGIPVFAGGVGTGKGMLSSERETWMRRPSIMAMAGEGNGAGRVLPLPEGGGVAPSPEMHENGAPPGSETRTAPSDQSPSTPTTAASFSNESLPPPHLALKGIRYHLPNTPYFENIRQTLSLTKLAGYAQAERRAGLVGMNLRNSLLIPMSGPHEYSPYGAGLVERIRENPEAVHTMTGKWDRAAIVSPGTAILGLGEAATGVDHVLMAEAADVIMQGKSKYFLWTAGVGAAPLCIRSYLSPDQRRTLEEMVEPRRRAEQARVWRAEEFARTVLALAPNFGFINIEDAQGRDLPIIFGLLESLKGNTSVWSDDKQGTGVITAAAMLGWAELTGRLDSEGRMPGIRGIIFGAGAGAMGVYDELLLHGVRPENILLTDSRGPLHEGRRDVEKDPYKVRMREGIPENTTVEEFAKGADFVINLGVKETLTHDMAWTEMIARSLAQNPFFGPMTNPEPGISPEMFRSVRPDGFYGSGNQVYENPVNNFTAFGYIGAGALMARAGGVGPLMTVAAARGIFEVAKMGPPPEIRDRLPLEQRDFGRSWLVPRPDDIRLIEYEAGAVARTAALEGLSILLGKEPSFEGLARFNREITEQVRARRDLVADMRERMATEGRRYLQIRYPQRYAPFSLTEGGEPLYEVAPEISRESFESFARQMGIRPEHWEPYLTPEGEIQPAALTSALSRLREATQADTPEAKVAFEELTLIARLAAVSPDLGLALAIRRANVRPENLKERPTIFHRLPVLGTVLQYVPEARHEIETAFPGIPEIQ